MEKLSLFLKSKSENIMSVLTGSYEKDAENEDPNAYRSLQNHIIHKNAGRVAVFSAVTLIVGILELIFGVGTVLCNVGSIILIISSVIFCWLCLRTSTSKLRDYSLMRLFTILFWLSFSAGIMFISAAEQINGDFPYSFLIFIASVFSVPVVRIYESLFFAGVMLIYPAVYGIYSEKAFIYYFSIIVLVVSYIWIAAVVRCCYSNIYIGECRLEMTEERCTQIARKDTLTGLLNKTGLSAKFSELSEEPGDKKISVILIDIDNFRLYNHTYGYEASDSCLYRVCNCIKILAKQYTELVSRFGGDDFVLILENMNEVETVKLAEQLRQSVETMSQPFGNSIVTVSVGVSHQSSLSGKETYSELLNEADDQLIIAKNSGRNCIGFNGRAFIQENRHPVAGQR